MLEAEGKEIELRCREMMNRFRELTLSVQNLETDLNERLSEVFGLNDGAEYTTPLEHVTLNANPRHRYDSDKSESELEALLLADTMREFISYAVGCMLGRYSLAKPGLILANQGETAEDYRRIVDEYLVASS